MGMKIQSKSYLPGFISMRDFNEESNAGSWSLFYEDRLSKNGRCYNGFTPGPLHANTEYDKEILRQTMLRQENTFRKQVYELHRLYRVQRNLMNEIPKDGHKCPLRNVIAQSIPFSSHMPSIDAQIILQPNLPITSSSSGGPSVPAAENGRISLNFLKERSNSEGECPAQNGNVSKHGFLSSNLKSLPKRPFDLQLPADEYIDIEDGGKNEEKIAHDVQCEKINYISSKIGSELETDTKLTLGAQNEQKYGLLLQNNAHFVTDLNKPLQESETTNVDDLASVKLVGPISPNRNIQDKQPLATLGLSKDFFLDNDNHIDSKKIPKFPYMEDEEKRIEWPSYNAKPDHSSDKSVPLYEPIQAEPKAPDLLPFLFSQTKRERHLMQKLVPEDDNDNFSLSNSWRKRTTSTTRVPVAVQALPCFKELASIDVKNKISSTAETWNLNSSERSVSGFGSDASSSHGFHPTAGLFLRGSHSEHTFSASDKRDFDSGYSAASGRPRKFLRGIDCTDVRFAKEMNLNFSFPNGLHNGVCVNNIPVSEDGEATVRSLYGGSDWLTTKLDNMPSKMGVCSDKHPSLPFMKSSSDIYREDVHKPEVADGPCFRKILGSSLLNMPNEDLSQFSMSSVLSKQKVSNGNNGENDCDTKLPYRRTWPESKDKFLEDEMRNVRSSIGISSRLDINLNAAAAICTEQRNQQNAMEVSTSDIIKASVKTKAHIDLEAPVNEDMMTWEEEYKIRDKFIAPNKLLHSEMRDLEATLIQSAAESIMAISASFHDKSDKGCSPSPNMSCSASVYNKFSESCSSSQDLLKDFLLWFADLVSNEANNFEGTRDQSKPKVGIDNEQSDKDSDYFEEMTLRLSEVDVSEYCNKSWERENSKGETGIPSLLSRPRKGNTRRGRQRRDFQRDILPGLASLSRHEVTEDLQTIGALMRGTGSSWQMGLARRNARNGCQTRGRRRLRSSNMVNLSLPRQPSISEMELEGLGLQGWGKTTRRARRQRYPTANVTSLFNLS